MSQFCLSPTKLPEPGIGFPPKATRGPYLRSRDDDRMPGILDPNTYELWLDSGMKDVDAASELMKPYDARLMQCYPVSTRINHAANDDASKVYSGLGADIVMESLHSRQTVIDKPS